MRIVMDEGYTIYVADDEELVRREIKNILESPNCRVCAYSTAEEAEEALAFAAASEQFVDVVLTDLDFGSDCVGGDVLTQHILEKDVYTRIVVMSGRESPRYLLDLVMRGASGRILKPFSAGELKRSVLSHAQTGRELYRYSIEPWASITRTRRDVFLIYSTADELWAFGLKRLLEDLGFSVWYADADLLSGSKWRGMLEKARDECHVFATLLSPAALSSVNMAAEISRAVDRAEQSDRNYLVLPLLRDVALGAIPRPLQEAPCSYVSDADELLGSLTLLRTSIEISRGRRLA